MDIDAFNEHYRSAWALLKRVMLLGTNANYETESLGEAEQAVGHFRACLALEPRSWQCLWGMGKAEQAQRNHVAALACFEGASALASGNPDVWREASIAALALGDGTKAVDYVTNALRLSPDDAGLHANAALALLMAHDDDQAERLARRACELDPSDAANEKVLKIVRDVRNGLRERPKGL